MSQNYSNKIVSLHLQKCIVPCSNSDVCYHLRKEQTSEDTVHNPSARAYYLDNKIKVYESVCYFDFHAIKRTLLEYKNYNITFSCAQMGDSLSDPNIREQIQLSVYTSQDIIQWKDYQKLFLIRNDDTWNLAKTLLQEPDTGKLHFILEQEYLTLDILREFIGLFQTRACKDQSADTCLTSFLVNGHCPYDSFNYIDINYDRTIRSCPYNPQGIPGNRLDLEHIFSVKTDYDCKFKRLFKGTINDGNKNTNLQDNPANNGNGSNSKRMRGLSLRS